VNDSNDSVRVRRADSSDIPLLVAWTNTEPVHWVRGASLSEELATGNYRPEWSWIAEQNGRPIGRALWWGKADAKLPATLDCLTLATATDAPERVGAALIRAGLDAFGDGSALEFNVDVPPDWTADAATVDAVEWRDRAARAGGFSRRTERVSFARTDSVARPARSTRLRFVQAPDDTFRALFGRVAAGSLDGHTLAMVEREGVEALADDDLEFYLSLPGEREAWRVAQLADATTVGFIIPTRTAYDASISYLGVVPEHRGRGFVDDLLAEMVHMHHDDGQGRIVGTTDAANAPMRSAFERAGFDVTRVRIVHER